LILGERTEEKNTSEMDRRTLQNGFGDFRSTRVCRFVCVTMSNQTKSVISHPPSKPMYFVCVIVYVTSPLTKDRLGVLDPSR
jgi:hypothetical protein